MSDSSLKLPSPFDKRVLNFGFIFGLFLATCCLALSGYYLNTFLRENAASMPNLLVASTGKGVSSSDLDFAISANLIVSGFALSSCGISLAMSFGFLGFCLFLIGVGGEMEVSGEKLDGAKINISRMAPGIFVLLCATVLAAICVTRRPELSFKLDAGAGSAITPSTGDGNPVTPPPGGGPPKGHTQ